MNNIKIIHCSLFIVHCSLCIVQKKFMKKKQNLFKLSSKEKLIEAIGIIIFAGVLIGSALKLLFF